MSNISDYPNQTQAKQSKSKQSRANQTKPNPPSLFPYNFKVSYSIALLSTLAISASVEGNTEDRSIQSSRN